MKEEHEQGKYCVGCDNYQRGVIPTPTGNKCPSCRGVA